MCHMSYMGKGLIQEYNMFYIIFLCSVQADEPLMFVQHAKAKLNAL